MNQRDDRRDFARAPDGAHRQCSRCERELSGREHYGQGGITVIWQCPCGWASARTVSSEEAHILATSKASGVRARPTEIEPSDESKQHKGEG
jgi:hypothetical protein